MKSLNAESLKIVQNLYDSKPLFRQGLDRLLHDEVKSALEFTSRLEKFVASGSDAEPSKTTTVGKSVKKTTPSGKKRGRPTGSKNVPKTPKTEPVEGEVVDAKLTHGSAILGVLKDKPEGLSAAEILSAISEAKFENYVPPSKATLQTTLVGLHGKKAVKTKGTRPNTKYFVK